MNSRRFMCRWPFSIAATAVSSCSICAARTASIWRAKSGSRASPSSRTMAISLRVTAFPQSIRSATSPRRADWYPMGLKGMTPIGEWRPM